MPIPTNRNTLIADITHEFGELRPVLGSIAPKDTSQPVLEGQIKNTRMSPHDLVAYLVGWGEEVLRWNRHWEETGKPCAIPNAKFGEIARGFYAAYAGVPWAGLLQKLDSIYGEILAFLDRRTEAELYETVWYTTLTSQQAYTFGRLIQLNTASPLRSAYHRLQHWRQVDD